MSAAKTMIPYSKFHATDDVRHYLNQPFNHGGYTVASDGHSILLSPLDHQFDGNTHPLSTIDNIIDIVIGTPVETLSEPLTLPEKPTCAHCLGTGKAPDMIECEECEGEGEVKLENDFNEYTCCCKSCGGIGLIQGKTKSQPCENCNETGKSYKTDGYLMPSAGTQINGSYYNNHLLDKIIHEPGLKIGQYHIDTERTDMAWLIFEVANQRGAIMPFDAT